MASDTDIDITDETAVRHHIRAMRRHIETLLDENRRLTAALADARIESARMYERCKPYLELPF
jgi:hypothetical protein